MQRHSRVSEVDCFQDSYSGRCLQAVSDVVHMALGAVLEHGLSSLPRHLVGKAGQVVTTEGSRDH